MSERFYDLHFEQLENGAIRLEQSGLDKDDIIDVHPEQIRYIARLMCGMKAETAHQVADLERRISVLADGLEKLVTADWLRSDIVERCGDGVEILCRLDALLDLALEFDGGRLLSGEFVPPHVSRPANAAPLPAERSPNQERTQERDVASGTENGTAASLPPVDGGKQMGLEV